MCVLIKYCRFGWESVEQSKTNKGELSSGAGVILKNESKTKLLKGCL